MKNPLMKKPMGPSELGRGFGSNWNNGAHGSDGPILCEICGTSHPEDRDQSYIVSKFLGYQVVEDCCGKILDIVYQESGEEFTTAFLEEFSENPTDPRFGVLLLVLKRVISEAAKKLAEVSEQVAEISEVAEALGKS